jgi:hypothetical protein
MRCIRRCSPRGAAARKEGARLIRRVNDRNAATQAAPRLPMGCQFHPPFTFQAGQRFRESLLDIL